LLSVVVVGLTLSALGRLGGRLVGSERAGAAVGAMLFATLSFLPTVARVRSRTRAALKALAGGAVVGIVFWIFSR
jgi:hypothetical protein